MRAAPTAVLFLLLTFLAAVTAPASDTLISAARRVLDTVRNTIRSPMWCGTSCASTASDAMTPRRKSATKADAISTPSPKQCTLSPVSTAQVPALGAWL